MSNITLYNDDCLIAMKNIPDKSVDLILCDLPYGTTSCKWDSVIPFNDLWKEYKRIITDTGVIALFGDNGMFTAKLICSNEKWFKYSWILEKTFCSSGTIAKYQPMRNIESISIFYKKSGQYYPQFKTGCKPYTRIYTEKDVSHSKLLNADIKRDINASVKDKTTRYPTLILNKPEFTESKNLRVHPSQKAVPLLEYLIKTYTTEGMTVLDNCMGSGSTGVAAKNLNRDFIGIEMDENYYKIANDRINNNK